MINSHEALLRLRLVETVYQLVPNACPKLRDPTLKLLLPDLAVTGLRCPAEWKWPCPGNSLKYMGKMRVKLRQTRRFMGVSGLAKAPIMHGFLYCICSIPDSNDLNA